MSRAQGRRHSPREPAVAPGTPEGDAIGMSERQQPGHSPIPGGATHLVNHPTESKSPPNPVPRPPFRGMMAHGVPPEAVEHHDREGMSHARQDVPAPTPLAKPVPPVPVYIVEGGSARPLKHTATKHIVAPFAGNEPVSCCGQDVNRISVKLLNEGNLSARFGQLNDLALDTQNNVIIGGSLLPASMSSYLKIETQGPLYVIASATSGTAPTISVIQEFEIPGAG